MKRPVLQRVIVDKENIKMVKETHIEQLFSIKKSSLTLLEMEWHFSELKSNNLSFEKNEIPFYLIWPNIASPGIFSECTVGDLNQKIVLIKVYEVYW